MSRNRMGVIPYFLNPNDPRSAEAQLQAGYPFGWHPFEGFTLHNGPVGKAWLEYPNDPPTREVGRVPLRDEMVIVFKYSWVAVIRADGSYVVVRMD